jgi:hypothetical protein
VASQPSPARSRVALVRRCRQSPGRLRRLKHVAVRPFGATQVAFERLHLRRKRAIEFIESAFRAVLLGNVVYMGEAAGECHARHVDGRHLGRKHCLELIPRLNSFDDGQHEIEPVLVEVPAPCPLALASWLTMPCSTPTS